MVQVDLSSLSPLAGGTDKEAGASRLPLREVQGWRAVGCASPDVCQNRTREIERLASFVQVVPQ